MPARGAVINARPNTLSVPVDAAWGPFCAHCGRVHPPRRVALNCRRCRAGFCTVDARYAYCTRDCRVFARRRQVRDAVRRWRASCR